MKRPDQSKALAELEAITEDMQISIPKNPADLWDWCIDLKPAQLMALLAFAASRSINAVVGKSSFRTKKQLAHADQLGMALGTDMRDYFQPTAESYFEHMNRSSIQAAVAEVKGEDFAKGIAAMKKKDAAAYAESALKGSDWLPAPLLFVQPVSEIDVDASPDDADDEETDIEEHGEERASAEIIQFPEAAA
ncbi:hypothetical protein OU993_18110 [Rhizobium sp. SL86]|nr:hypothetical protein [Rhizobium sp. SL86]